MSNRENAIHYVKNNYINFESTLVELVKIPSISTSPIHQKDIRSAAEYIQTLLLNIGIQETKILETSGHPVVYGSYVTQQKDAPTVLIYGHYDVQPVDPLELWTTDPFQPVIKNDRMFGRGASDMKGQIVASLSAVEAVIQTGKSPVNFKFIIEGEEEIGSPHLHEVLETQTVLFKNDVILNPDAGMISPSIPTIVYGLRGLAYFELKIFGPDHDLHSGLFGGVVHNPAIVLAELIAGMHDKDGVITLPGFYDEVISLSTDEREKLSRLPITEEDIRKQTGVKELWGERGYSHIERTGSRPTLDVNGLLSGFIGEGSKTVIPAWAMAKISMRLVPNQDPEHVRQQLIQYLTEKMPSTVSWDLKKFAGGSASMANTSHPGVIALEKALEKEWGTKPVYKREGGSIPVVAEMQKHLGSDSILTGFGLPEDNIHSPNEKLHLPTWRKGILALVHFFYEFAGENENK
jgi:acetylornithine deacetylase/succinyl-diaminopimelate desuccinylase-like protein